MVCLVCDCVAAEMLLGKPLLPGYSSMNQLERTVELTGAPSCVALPHAAVLVSDVSDMWV